MRLRHRILAVAIAGTCACNSSQTPRQANDSKTAPAPAGVPAAVDQPATATPSPAAKPSPPTRIPVVDPRSPQAAEEAVRAFVGLLNRGKFDQAYMLLGPSAPSRSDFDHRFTSWTDLRATMGKAEEEEGAAGSSYITVPVQLTGRQDGKQAQSSVDVVLRRVNDVPGSTEAQRHWHIEQVNPRPS